MQTTFAVNMLALVDRQPRMITLKEALEAFIDHRREVIRRRSEFDLEKARDRAHILEGLLKALDNLDAVIAAIRASASADAAKTALQGTPFDLSERQAQAVLDMQLRRLAQLERASIRDEHAELMERIAYLEDLLANPAQDRRADQGRLPRADREVRRRRAGRRSSRRLSRTSPRRTWSRTSRSSSRSRTAAT